MDFIISINISIFNNIIIYMNQALTITMYVIAMIIIIAIFVYVIIRIRDIPGSTIFGLINSPNPIVNQQQIGTIGQNIPNVNQQRVSAIGQ